MASVRLPDQEGQRSNSIGSRAEPRDHQLSELEEAVSSKDARAFDRILDSIDWSNRPAAEFIFVIDLALRIGAFEIATRTSIVAKEHHPDDQEIQKYAYVLAPPKVSRSHRDPDPSIRANRDWLKAHSDEYHGKWVALRNGELLDSADSVSELMERIANEKNLLVTPVS